MFTVRCGWLDRPAPLLAELAALGTYDAGGRWSLWLDHIPLADRLPWATMALVQAYRDGQAHTGWHTDGAYARTAVLALGATRLFGLRVDGREHLIPLSSGDLVEFDTRLEHAVPQCSTPTGERLAVVYRSTHQHT